MASNKTVRLTVGDICSTMCVRKQRVILFSGMNRVTKFPLVPPPKVVQMEQQKQPEEKLGLLLDLYNSIPEYSGVSHVRNHFIRKRDTQFLRKQ